MNSTQFHETRFIESEIYALFDLLKEPQSVCDTLNERIQNKKISIEDQGVLWSFYSLIGEVQSLLPLFIFHIENKYPISWFYLVETLNALGHNFTSEFAELCWQGAQEQNLTYELCRTKHLDPWLPELPTLRSERQNRVWIKFQEKREQLLKESAMFRSQGIDIQEKKCLDELLGLYSEDSEVIQLYQDFKIRKALQLVDNQFKNKPSNKLNKTETLKNEIPIQQLKSAMINEIKIQGNSQSLIYDFAVHLGQMELYQEGLELLKLIQNHTLPTLWLSIEYNQKLGRHFEALEFIETLEKTNQFDVANLKAITYEKSQCLWHIGESKEAYALLEQLIKIDPDYRNSHHLLRLWRLNAK